MADEPVHHELNIADEASAEAQVGGAPPEVPAPELPVAVFTPGAPDPDPEHDPGTNISISLAPG